MSFAPSEPGHVFGYIEGAHILAAVSLVPCRHFPVRSAVSRIDGDYLNFYRTADIPPIFGEVLPTAAYSIHLRGPDRNQGFPASFELISVRFEVSHCSFSPLS